MPKRSLTLQNAISLILAADIRFCQPDYCNDQIWEFRPTSGDPSAPALHTTFGLRAQSMRIFPLFTEAGKTVSKLSDFADGLQFEHIFPNFIAYHFSPFAGIDVSCQVWIPESHAIAGRVRIRNSGPTSRKVRLEWAAQLVPTGKGSPITPMQINEVNVLAGNSANLAPLIWMSGGAPTVSSPLPAFVIDLDLPPGRDHQFTWVHAAEEQAAESLISAQRIAARPWDAEVARIIMQNRSQVSISTGEPEWDHAFRMAQNAAFSLLHQHAQQLPFSSFVSSRLPEHGYSMRGDGSDHPIPWSGQTPLDAWVLSQIFMPADFAIVAGWIENFLHVQDEEGHIDGKPGLGGQRSNFLAAPFLAELTWQVYQRNQDTHFLEKVFPGLLKFFHSWFTKQHDRDGDGVPEWDHVSQTGLENHPAFTRWQAWSQGAEISTVEAPCLIALLFHESQTLLKIAQQLGETSPIGALEAIAQNLKQALALTWSAEHGRYLAIDRDSHVSSAKQQLGKTTGAEPLEINQSFETPIRALITLTFPEGQHPAVDVFLHGTDPKARSRVEKISISPAQWVAQRGTLTSQQVYAHLERVEFHGLPAQGKASVACVDLEFDCISHFLPLWAGMSTPEQAKSLHKHIQKQFSHSFGLSTCPAMPNQPEAEPSCLAVQIPWNTFVLEGLFHYGYSKEAAQIFSNLMAGVIQNLKQDHTFRQSMHAATGKGQGQRMSLHGLPPIHTFLKIAGIDICSQWEVKLTGENAFPWPVRVQYQGLLIERQPEQTQVTFPNGEKVTIPEPAACRVVGRSGESATTKK